MATALLDFDFCLLLFTYFTTLLFLLDYLLTYMYVRVTNCTTYYRVVCITLLLATRLLLLHFIIDIDMTYHMYVHAMYMYMYLLPAAVIYYDGATAP